MAPSRAAKTSNRGARAGSGKTPRCGAHLRGCQTDPDDKACRGAATLTRHTANIPASGRRRERPRSAGKAALPANGWGYFLLMHCTRRQPLKRFTRSEEHTSELQSRLHLVCRLLLEKKKNKDIRHGVQ